MTDSQDKGTDKRDHPFFQVDNVVLELGLTALEIALYVAIVKFANRKTGAAFPSTTTLAKTAGMNKRTVLRCLATLEERKLIAVVRQPGRPSHYYLLDPHDATPAPTGDTESPVTDSHQTDDTESPGDDTESPQPVTDGHQPDQQDESSNQIDQPDDLQQSGADDNRYRALIEKALAGIGLTAGETHDQVLEMDPATALALIWHCCEVGRSPAGLLVTLARKKQAPPADLVRLAGVALEHGTTNREEATRLDQNRRIDDLLGAVPGTVRRKKYNGVGPADWYRSRDQVRAALLAAGVSSADCDALALRDVRDQVLVISGPNSVADHAALIEDAISKRVGTQITVRIEHGNTNGNTDSPDGEKGTEGGRGPSETQGLRPDGTPDYETDRADVNVVDQPPPENAA